MISAGIDIGSRTIKVVVLNGGGIMGQSVVSTGAHPLGNARKTFGETLASAGLARKDLSKVVATGYGRNYFAEADAVSSEILCHAKGITHFFPEARTVIDIGGQDSKMISLGPEGKVMNFVMNDRCAAGTGKFIEMVSLMLDIPLDEMGGIASSGETCEISSMCAVFAESEIIGLTQSGTPEASVLRGVFRSVARRTLAMAGRLGLVPEVVFTGGVARNQAVKAAIETEAGVSLLVPPEPQITGALGAALIASGNSGP